MQEPIRLPYLVAVCVFSCLVAGCGQGRVPEEQITRIPVDSLEGVLTRSGVTFDQAVSADGNGSLRLEAEEPVTFRLYEIDDPDVENCQLIYRAKVRTEGVTGQAYLEMWCRFPGSGEFFSRGLQAPLTGTTEWTSQEIHFRLEKGQNPDLVKLNMVIDGKGTVWIDDVVLAKGPLR
jgi:hypothetical protein